MNNRALILGTILNGKYRIERIVGEGGFGITYQATDLLIDETVAIKEYFPSNLASRDTKDGLTTELTIITGNDIVSFENGLSKFEKEASNLAKFQNIQGIVKVKNFFHENNTGYMVMEYIDGISLKEYLKSVGGKLEYTQTLEMIESVLEALSLVHKEGIIHRDISPDNIMVTKEKELKLIDFGAARFVGNEDEKSLTIMLKEGYAPPEQYRTDGKQGSWTDVYALCATMYRMISGEVPVDSVTRVLDKDSLVPLRKMADVPQYVEKAIMKGLATSVNNRILTIEGLKKRLNRARCRILYIVKTLIIFALFIPLILFFKNKLNTNNPTNIESVENEIVAETIANEEVLVENASESVENTENIIEPVENIENILPEYFREYDSVFDEQYVEMHKNRYFIDINNDTIEEMIVAYTYIDDSGIGRKIIADGDSIGIDIWSNLDNNITKVFSECQSRQYDKGFNYYVCSIDGDVNVFRETWEWNDEYIYSYEENMDDSFQFVSMDNDRYMELSGKALVLNSTSYPYYHSYDDISKEYSNDNILQEINALEGVLNIASEQKTNVLDYEIINVDGEKGIYVSLANFKSLNDKDVYNDEINIAFYDWNNLNYVSEIILLDENISECMDVSGFEKFSFGKWQHYYVTLGGSGYEGQHKFGYQEGKAFEIQMTNPFVKDNNGNVTLSTGLNGKDSKIDIFYVDKQYVEFGCKVISSIDNFENYDEIKKYIYKVITETEEIGGAFEVIPVHFSDVEYQQILKSDTGYYYMNFSAYNEIYQQKQLGHVILHEQNGQLVFDQICWQKRNVREIENIPLYFVNDNTIIEPCMSPYELENLVYSESNAPYVLGSLCEDFNNDYKFEVFAYVADSYGSSYVGDMDQNASIWYSDGKSTYKVADLNENYRFEQSFVEYRDDKVFCIIERVDINGSKERNVCIVDNETPMVYVE